VCLIILDQRKQAKMQWIQSPRQNIIDNLTMYDGKLTYVSGTKRRNV